MTYKICYWDEISGEQKERDATPEEAAEIEARKTALPTINEYVSYAQEKLDNFAKSRNYDGILSACTYASSSVPKFASEGTRCISLRDETWNTCYQIFDDVQSGKIKQPTLTEFDSMLPILAWP